MPFITETVNENDKALLIYDEPSAFAHLLVEEVKKFTIDIDEKTRLPLLLRDYEYFFIYKKHLSFESLKKLPHRKKICIITSDKNTYTQLYRRLDEFETEHNIKLIYIDENDTNIETIEKILWFFNSQTKEHSLNLEHIIKPSIKVNPQKIFMRSKLTRRRIFFAGIIGFLILELFFIIPLISSAWFAYKAGLALKEQKIDTAEKNVSIARSHLAVTRISYQLSRPFFHFFFIALLPENIMNIEKNAIIFIENGINVHKKSHRLTSLLLKQDKTPEEIAASQQLIKDLDDSVHTLTESSEMMGDELNYENKKIQSIKDDLEKLHENLRLAGTITRHLDDIVGGKGKRKYLVFFYNNMEIRPGGGFIGSFAIINFDKYTLKDFNVFDVYDADGQLTYHVEPPMPIRKYLHQPHWFLRDSNFNPDFEQNTQTAEYFLEKELGMKDFDGTFGVTTTALSYIIESFGNVYIADIDDFVNRSNFYYKTQLNSEQKFFPGSKQKKSYLSLIARTLFLKLQEADPLLLARNAELALQEKHIVLSFKNPLIQNDIVNLGWSGKTVAPRCVSSTRQCVINHILPIDANLGVNKANYYMSRFFTLKTTVDKDGEINNSLTTSFNNASPLISKFGGVYRNYFQLYIPNNATVSSVRFNNQIISYDEKETGQFKTIGAYIEIPQKTLSDLTVEYTLKEKIKKGANALQIVVQKQIGASNDEFTFELHLPRSVIVSDKNFVSLAKNNTVIYNTHLSTDRIFVIELVKE